VEVCQALCEGGSVCVPRTWSGSCKEGSTGIASSSESLVERRWDTKPVIGGQVHAVYSATGPHAEQCSDSRRAVPDSRRAVF
jgi:hypothetical protein